MKNIELSESSFIIRRYKAFYDTEYPSSSIILVALSILFMLITSPLWIIFTLSERFIDKERFPTNGFGSILLQWSFGGVSVLLFLITISLFSHLDSEDVSMYVYIAIYMLGSPLFFYIAKLVTYLAKPNILPRIEWKS